MDENYYNNHTENPDNNGTSSPAQSPSVNIPEVKSYTATGYDRYTAANENPAAFNPSAATEKKKKEKRKIPLSIAVLSGTAAAIVSGVLVALIMVWGMGFGGLLKNFSSNDSGDTGSLTSNTVVDSAQNSGSSGSTIVVNANQTSAEAVAEKAGPSVVSIVANASVNYYFYGTSDYASEGSGIIYSQDGYIITNYHVIQDSVENNGKVMVYLPQDSSEGLEATVIGYDISSDLAVLKVEKTGLSAIEIGDSDSLSVGQTAIAIGSPGGMDFMGSVSMGIISGLDRTLQLENSNTEINLIQTDAAINPGNSGGALVDSGGKLIGINSAKMASENFEGMGFAIPVNDAVEIIDRIIQNIDSPQPYIGVEISTYYDGDTLQMMGYPAGVVVADVVEGSPADQAGLMRSDIVTHFNGAAVTTYAQFNSEKAKYQPGETIELTVYRRGQSYDIAITLGTANQ